MKFYHYTSAEKFRGIETGDSYRKTGLIPIRRFMPLGMNSRCGLPSKATDGAVYGLLAPMDIGWCRHTFHAGEPLLQTVLGGISMDRERQIYLLEATVLAEDDVYVANYAPHLRPEYKGLDGSEKIVKQVKQDYWNSFIPFSEYIRGNTKYLIPEVISFSPIPLERLRVIEIRHQHDVINAVRERGGFAPLPPERKSDHSTFDEIFGLKRPEDPKSSGLGPDLRLV